MSEINVLKASAKDASKIGKIAYQVAQIHYQQTDKEFKKPTLKSQTEYIAGSIADKDILVLKAQIGDEIVGYVRTSLKYTETTNDILWKHMWLSYCSFVMHRMKYYYFCEVLKKERICLEETHDDDFVRLMATINVSSKVLTKGEAILEAPRFVDALIYDNQLPNECKDVFDKKQKIVELANNNKNLFVFKTNYLNNNKYINIGEFVFDGLIILRTGFEITTSSIYNCFDSVLNIEDSERFTDFCNKLNNIIK